MLPAVGFRILYLKMVLFVTEHIRRGQQQDGGDEVG